MTKIEKVIKALECHRKRSVCVNDEGKVCPYFSDEDCYLRLTDDALELLKAKYKPRESLAMLPCKCGCKRREHWYGTTYDKTEGLRCKKCGFEVWGTSAADAIRKWNERMSKN